MYFKTILVLKVFSRCLIPVVTQFLKVNILDKYSFAKILLFFYIYLILQRH